MTHQKNNFGKKTARFVTGSLIAGSMLSLGAADLTASNLNDFEELGSGGELRAELLGQSAQGAYSLEFTCGENTCGGGDDAKGKENNCGGDQGGDGKEANKKEGKQEGKDGEAKCGESSCGGLQ
jgi:hypothetical protein